MDVVRQYFTHYDLIASSAIILYWMTESSKGGWMPWMGEAEVCVCVWQ